MAYYKFCSREYPEEFLVGKHGIYNNFFDGTYIFILSMTEADATWAKLKFNNFNVADAAQVQEVENIISKGSSRRCPWTVI